jgi:glycine cleavage system H lipoate-binding protein
MQDTRRWWNTDRIAFELYISDFVMQEISKGDSVAAAERLKVVADVPLVPITPQVISLASALVAAHALPGKARVDAAHIAAAAADNIDL